MLASRMRFFSAVVSCHSRATLDELLAMLPGVFGVLLEVPVEQVLEGADEEGAGSACRVEDAQAGRLLRREPLEQAADRVLHDVVDDVGGRVVDAAGLLDLGL